MECKVVKYLIDLRDEYFFNGYKYSYNINSTDINIIIEGHFKGSLNFPFTYLKIFDDLQCDEILKSKLINWDSNIYENVIYLLSDKNDQILLMQDFLKKTNLLSEKIPDEYIFNNFKSTLNVLADVTASGVHISI